VFLFLFLFVFLFLFLFLFLPWVSIGRLWVRRGVQLTASKAKAYSRESVACGVGKGVA